MATTDTRLAARLLRSLDELGIDYRVLHRADDIESRSTISDVDIVVRSRPLDVLRRLARTVPVHGLVPLMLWNYDHGSLTSFWSTPDGSDGVQLDLLHDPHGRGRYGLRTEVAFAPEHSEIDRWPPRLAETSRLVYLLSKRTAKGDRARAIEIASLLRGADGGQRAVETADALLSRRSRRRWGRAMNDVLPRRSAHTVERWRSRIGLRGAHRMFVPVGAVVDVDGADVDTVQEMADSFDRYLVRAYATQLVSARSRFEAWWATRRRPTLVLNARPQPSAQRPGRPRSVGSAAADPLHVVEVLHRAVAQKIGVCSDVH